MEKHLNTVKLKCSKKYIMILVFIPDIVFSLFASIQYIEVFLSIRPFVEKSPHLFYCHVIKTDTVFFKFVVC